MFYRFCCVEVVASKTMEELFESIGLSKAKAKDTTKNAQVSNCLQSLIEEVRRDVITFCDFFSLLCRAAFILVSQEMLG